MKFLELAFIHILKCGENVRVLNRVCARDPSY